MNRNNEQLNSKLTEEINGENYETTKYKTIKKSIIKFPKENSKQINEGTKLTTFFYGKLIMNDNFELLIADATIQKIAINKSEYFSEEIIELTKLRLSANEMFKKKQFKQALKIYREIELDLSTIIYKPEEKSIYEEELLRIKINIIVTLFEQNEYRKTIININEILDNKMNSEKQSKLLRIRAKSSRLLSNIFNFEDVEKAIHLDPKNHLNIIELNEMKKQKFSFEQELTKKYIKNRERIEEFYKDQNVEEKNNGKIWSPHDMDFEFD
eukprot:gene9550-1754_t